MALIPVRKDILRAIAKFLETLLVCAVWVETETDGIVICYLVVHYGLKQLSITFCQTANSHQKYLFKLSLIFSQVKSKYF